MAAAGASTMSSYRDYEAEAKVMVEKLLTSTLERVKKEKKQKQAPAWPLVSQYSKETVEESIHKFVQVKIFLIIKMTIHI